MTGQYLKIAECFLRKFCPVSTFVSSFNVIFFSHSFNDFISFFHSQGLPSCPVSLEALRSHLPYLGYCLNFSDDKNEQHTDEDNNTNNNNFVIGDLYGNQKDQFGPNLTPLHRFYREQQQRKKMPGFRGRRGLCGCLQVSFCMQI